MIQSLKHTILYQRDICDAGHAEKILWYTPVNSHCTKETTLKINYNNVICMIINLLTFCEEIVCSGLPKSGYIMAHIYLYWWSKIVCVQKLSAMSVHECEQNVNGIISLQIYFPFYAPAYSECREACSMWFL